MNFDWDDRDNAIRDKVAEQFDREALLEIEAMEGAGTAGIRDMTRRYMGRLAEAGYMEQALGPKAKEDVMAWLAAQEVLAGISGSLFLAVEVSTRLFGGLIAGWGGPSLAQTLLEPLRLGQLIGAVALAEPGGPEPCRDWQTQGRAENGGFVVNGRKSFVTNGPMADRVAVAGEVDGQPAFFLVGPGQDGLAVGPRMQTLGYNGLTVSSLGLSGARVSADQVIGPLEDDSALDYLRNMQDLILSMASIGVMKRVMDAANIHCRGHHRGAKPVYAHQEVRFKLADMFTMYQTAQLMTRRAGWLFSKGDREAGVLIGCAKVFSAESADRAARLGMEIMAGTGYLSGNPVERGFREAKYAGLAGTSTEVARMNVAQDTLRRYPV